MIKQMHKIKCDKAPLTPDEMDVLSVMARAGDDRAAWKMVEHNSRFVFHLVAQICSPEHFEDLFQVGIMAAFIQAKKWDRALGANYTSYASQRIRADVDRARDNLMTTVTRSTKDACRQMTVRNNPHLEGDELKLKIKEEMELWKDVGSSCDIEDAFSASIKDHRFDDADFRIDYERIKKASDWMPKKAREQLLNGTNGIKVHKNSKKQNEAIKSIRKIMELV